MVTTVLLYFMAWLPSVLINNVPCVKLVAVSAITADVVVRAAASFHAIVVLTLVAPGSAVVTCK